MPELFAHHAAPLPGTALEESIAAVELRLAALAEALRMRNTPAIDCQANELQHALAQAVQRFSQAARRGPVAPALRRRLGSAGRMVAAQRESLARATAALDRAIDVLMPQPTQSLYGAQGVAQRGARGGVIQA